MIVEYLSYPGHLTLTKMDQPLSVAIGFFDGIHLGHQQVIEQAKKVAKEKGIQSAVMTFDPHPSIVLGHRNERVFYITPLEQKLELLKKMDIDVVIIIRFTSDFASLSAKDFIEQVLVNNRILSVTAGFDFSFGAFGKGTMDTLRRESNDRYAVHEIQRIADPKEKISSTRIREELTTGDMLAAKRMLGRPYRFPGIVVHGDKRGRTIGFPTANIAPSEGVFIPKVGVYAVKMLVQDSWVNGVCNVGYKPTVQDPEGKKLTVEVHLFNFDKTIYGEHVEVAWFDRIRDEQKFNGLDELKMQIEKDKQQAELILEKALH
ncbi:bifunctional riboflavin kinase/FAD synthetase [Paenisporosarcina cavernae]|uniref:Riboflavin biosynthesis protein n=1 Tax=Paenisporosarcina cavernae TaxID=2320858 RepID=A0A385YS08_9BACL|nr:bifunctional riboflavin kinase/FAD synthetase [Paenisporosarcina cavernae]AYC29284.1 bifunctional riboflavin kinase/FAD synthetase [Paenisporosarcina cavernae]